MDYLWIKALHVAAVIVWIGGMLVTAVILSALKVGMASEQQISASFLTAVQAWDRRVTSPAMLVVWALGMTLAMQGGWFSNRWLMVKLALVFFLSGVHGVLSGRLRRLGRAPEQSPTPGIRFAAPVIFGVTFAVVTLVIVKPF